MRLRIRILRGATGSTGWWRTCPSSRRRFRARQERRWSGRRRAGSGDLDAAVRDLRFRVGVERDALGFAGVATPGVDAVDAELVLAGRDPRPGQWGLADRFAVDEDFSRV